MNWKYTAMNHPFTKFNGTNWTPVKYCKHCIKTSNDDMSHLPPVLLFARVMYRTPRCKCFLHKLIVIQPTKKFSAVTEPRRLGSVYMKVHIIISCYVIPNPLLPSHPASSVTMLIFTPSLQSGLYLSGVKTDV